MLMWGVASCRIHAMPDIEIILVLGVAAGAVYLFITEKVRIDVTALIVLVALLALRLVSPARTLYGFANPATGTVACMFVLSAGLGRTGLVDWLARWLDKLAGTGERRLVLVICIAIAVISTVVVNTATVAIFLPVAMVLAKLRKVAESRVLMPLSFASQFGGVCTLVGTSTNILVNSIAVSAGLAAFGLFEFARLGIVMACVGVVYLVLAGKWLLPEHSPLSQWVTVSVLLLRLELDLWLAMPAWLPPFPTWDSALWLPQPRVPWGALPRELRPQPWLLLQLVDRS